LRAVFLDKFTPWSHAIAFWVNDDVGSASVAGLPGCHTYGDSYVHLIEKLQDAIVGGLEVAIPRESLNDQQQ
jgi:predicted RNase H-like HicB family nuclease